MVKDVRLFIRHRMRIERTEREGEAERQRSRASESERERERETKRTACIRMCACCLHCWYLLMHACMHAGRQAGRHVPAYPSNYCVHLHRSKVCNSSFCSSMMQGDKTTTHLHVHPTCEQVSSLDAKRGSPCRTKWAAMAIL